MHSSPEASSCSYTRNVAELPIFPCTSVEISGPPATSSSLLLSKSSSASSTVSLFVTASAVPTCTSKAIAIGFSAIWHYLWYINWETVPCRAMVVSWGTVRSALFYDSTIGRCPVPECIAASWAYIDVCERFHERDLRQQQRSVRFGLVLLSDLCHLPPSSVENS